MKECRVVSEPRGDRTLVSDYSTTLFLASLCPAFSLDLIRREITRSPDEILYGTFKGREVKSGSVCVQLEHRGVHSSTLSSLCVCLRLCKPLSRGTSKVENDLTLYYSVLLWSPSTYLPRFPRRSADAPLSVLTQCTWLNVELVRILPLYAPLRCIGLRHTHTREIRHT